MVSSSVPSVMRDQLTGPLVTSRHLHLSRHLQGVTETGVCTQLLHQYGLRGPIDCQCTVVVGRVSVGWARVALTWMNRLVRLRG